MTKPAEFIELWQSRSGIDVIKGIASGELPSAPHAARVGLTMVEAVAGRIELTWRPTAEVANPQGNIHGGYVAMVLDDACCMSAVTLQDSFVPMLTLSLNIDYLRVVRPGESYAVTGTVVHAGKRRTVTRATIADTEGSAIAQATGSVTPNLAFAPAASS